MSCGCRGKKNRKKQKVSTEAQQKLNTMSATEAQKPVPLGLSESVHLPTRISGVLDHSRLKYLVITEKDDNRLFSDALVVRGRDGLVAASLREKLVARYPGFFEEALEPAVA